MIGDRILLDHGSGGRAAHDLVTELFLSVFQSGEPAAMEDSALVDFPQGKLALTTDGFVVTPIFFPGGDIGDLAVNGTVNDLAMRGARPLYLTAGFILEEGLLMADLERIVASMARAAAESGVRIVAGDTKVVPKGAADQVFITTSGVGLAPADLDISATRARAGDAVLISGTMGDHGMAVMCAREGLELTTPIVSDTAGLFGLVEALLTVGGNDIHVLRDPTRGGVGTTLNEIARSSGVDIVLDESALPVTETVRGACDLLGLDPIYVANEGKLLVLAAAGREEALLRVMREHPLGQEATMIGRVGSDRPGRVTMTTTAGGARMVGMLAGEQLPRIC